MAADSKRISDWRDSLPKLCERLTQRLFADDLKAAWDELAACLEEPARDGFGSARGKEVWSFIRPHFSKMLDKKGELTDWLCDRSEREDKLDLLRDMLSLAEPPYTKIAEKLRDCGPAARPLLLGMFDKGLYSSAAKVSESARAVGCSIDDILRALSNRKTDYASDSTIEHTLVALAESELPQLKQQWNLLTPAVRLRFFGVLVKEGGSPLLLKLGHSTEECLKQLLEHEEIGNLVRFLEQQAIPSYEKKLAWSRLASVTRKKLADEILKWSLPSVEFLYDGINDLVNHISKVNSLRDVFYLFEGFNERDPWRGLPNRMSHYRNFLYRLDGIASRLDFLISENYLNSQDVAIRINSTFHKTHQSLTSLHSVYAKLMDKHKAALAKEYPNLPVSMHDLLLNLVFPLSVPAGSGVQSGFSEGQNPGPLMGLHLAPPVRIEEANVLRFEYLLSAVQLADGSSLAPLISRVTGTQADGLLRDERKWDELRDRLAGLEAERQRGGGVSGAETEIRQGMAPLLGRLQDSSARVVEALTEQPLRWLRLEPDGILGEYQPLNHCVTLYTGMMRLISHRPLCAAGQSPEAVYGALHHIATVHELVHAHLINGQNCDAAEWNGYAEVPYTVHEALAMLYTRRMLERPETDSGFRAVFEALWRYWPAEYRAGPPLTDLKNEALRSELLRIREADFRAGAQSPQMDSFFGAGCAGHPLGSGNPLRLRTQWIKQFLARAAASGYLDERSIPVPDGKREEMVAAGAAYGAAADGPSAYPDRPPSGRR